MQKCTSLKLIHYADDSTALATDGNPNNLCLFVNNELEKIDEWTRANKLSLNIDKTYFSLITTKIRQKYSGYYHQEQNHN